MRLELPMTAPVDVQVQTEDGTWVMPPGASAVQVVIIAGGGGGSHARWATSGSYASGGGGGAGGGWLALTVPAAALPESVDITIGMGGAGGVSAVSDPQPGGSTAFGAVFGVLGGGNGGLNDPTDLLPSNPHGKGFAPGSMIRSTDGGAPGDVNSVGSGYSPNLDFGGCPGGGGGGSILADGTVGEGGPGKWSVVDFSPNEGGAGGGLPGVAGGDGFDTVSLILPGPGTSGGGGGANASGPGGNGGNGGRYGAGGGGGGASASPTAGERGGSGGRGGDGIAIVITYF